MKTIYLIRHGETEWNLKKKTQGQSESNLSSKGIKQAQKAGIFLENKKIDKIYTSDLKRAVHTANLINEYINKEIIESKNLREMHFGQWEGINVRELYNDNNYIEWLKNPINVNIKDGENLKDLSKRAKAFLENDLNKEDDTILIVSHTAFLKVLILELLGISLEHFKNLKMNNTGISRIDIRDYNNVLNYYNSTEHLNK